MTPEHVRQYLATLYLTATSIGIAGDCIWLQFPFGSPVGLLQDAGLTFDDLRMDTNIHVYIYHLDLERAVNAAGIATKESGK